MRVLVTLVFILLSTASIADEALCDRIIDKELSRLMTITGSDYVDPKDFQRAQVKMDSLKEQRKVMGACELVKSEPKLERSRKRIQGV